MPSPRIRPSLTTPPAESSAASKRRVSRSRELWISYFQSALDSLMSNDQDDEKELEQDEADKIIRSASRIADAALAMTEERFQGL